DQKLTYRLDYVTVPLVVVIPLGQVMELQGGGYLGYMVLSEIRREGDLGDATYDPKDGKFNGFDYGLVGGATINLGLG
ncbi:PorT family protein, partial [Klebsiella pneumoniae]|nr:PorT family protein [Klebsiella pneumoniae]